MGNTNGNSAKDGRGQMMASGNVHVFYMDCNQKYFIVKVILLNRSKQRILSTPKDGQQRDADLDELGGR